ncbi:hypothetical protein L202_03189 [Cryptococcus amylolentus CBS 6039]|uniref:Uncharacterized protein n=1 Tax=Cryptococcus amylolentus CBS 6039 TaxID=1295533 RepID=A0A1E3HXP1_9TREE|nr:hypothetical protein L202_03189 [Cryptococcus amylolentus CBS 6039]ODN81094.1 hypothetical protein L202_03189 [Cryptococcus amylolentus CBS 6039]
MGQKSSSQRRDRRTQASTVRHSTPATVARYHPPPPEQSPAVTNNGSPALNLPFDIYLNNRQSPFDRHDPTGLFAPTPHHFVIETFRKSPLRDAVRIVDHYANPEPIAHESIRLLNEGVTMIRNCDPSFVFLQNAEEIKRVVDQMVPKAEELFDFLSESRKMSFAWHNPKPGVLESDHFTPESIQKLKSGFATFARSGVYINELVDDEKKTGESKKKTRKEVGKEMKADKLIVMKAFKAFGQRESKFVRGLRRNER